MRYADHPFRVAGLYRLVRHAMSLVLNIALWAAPRMTAGHLLFALATAGYTLLVVRFLEERDLAAALGDTYVASRCCSRCPARAHERRRALSHEPS